jgi:hypothetical protein
VSVSLKGVDVCEGGVRNLRKNQIRRETEKKEEKDGDGKGVGKG